MSIEPRATRSSDEADGICVRMAGIGKSFSGVQVLRDINLDFRQGEIHGLVGENGAGKSTVGKIAGGYYSRSSGELEVFGERVDAWDAATALRHGIAMMHQELQLVPELTVAQNVFLGIETHKAGLLAGDENRRIEAIVAMCGFHLDPAARAGSLSIADQQKIEVMRAMARDARVIVMDEPTSSLTADEIERLHQTMRRLRETGRTIIYVSHFLDDVLTICDRVTIMRDGTVVRTADARDETKASLVASMLGRADAELSYPEKPVAPATHGEPALKVDRLTAATGIRDIAIEVYPGEIVGLIGLVGSGRTEIARAVFGADRSLWGDVLIDGVAYRDRTPERSIARGIAMVPEDRRREGLVLTQPVRPNMTLPQLSSFARMGLMRRGAETGAVRRFIDYLGIHPRHVDGDVATYSGGNQQKVLLGKWIMGSPKIVILDEPSRGVDLGARRRIHKFVVELARGGAAVLLISSEMEEVLGLAHRAYLVRRGRIAGEVVPGTVSEDEILWTLFQEEDVTPPEKRAS